MQEVGETGHVGCSRPGPSFLPASEGVRAAFYNLASNCTGEA